VTKIAQQGPIERAAGRLAHALSLVWLTSAALTPFAATGAPRAALPDRGEPAPPPTSTTPEIPHADEA